MIDAGAKGLRRRVVFSASPPLVCHAFVARSFVRYYD